MADEMPLASPAVACASSNMYGAAADFLLNRTHCLIAPTADKVPNASPTAASASSDMYGSAAADACQQLNARLAPYRERLAGKPFKVGALGACGEGASSALAAKGCLTWAAFLSGAAQRPRLPHPAAPFASPTHPSTPAFHCLAPPMQEIVMAAYLDRVDLSAHGFYATPDITGFGGDRPFNYLCYGKQWLFHGLLLDGCLI